MEKLSFVWWSNMIVLWYYSVYVSYTYNVCVADDLSRNGKMYQGHRWHVLILSPKLVFLLNVFVLWWKVAMSWPYWPFSKNNKKRITSWWFQIFIFSTLPGEMIRFDEYFFQLGWNHQLGQFDLFVGMSCFEISPGKDVENQTQVFKQWAIDKGLLRRGTWSQPNICGFSLENKHEQWKKGPWLFSGYRGLYYPVLCGDFWQTMK